MIKSNIIPDGWVTNKLENNNAKEVLPLLMKILKPMSGFPAWGSDKGMGILRESGHEGQQDLIIGHSEARGKQRLQS